MVENRVETAAMLQSRKKKALKKGLRRLPFRRKPS
jgi:hypothetical protein